MDVYSFLNVSLLVSGVEITGYADGDDVIQVARREDSQTDVMGADGFMSVSRNANKSGTVIFRLMQTSKSNAYLSGLVNSAEAGVDPAITVQMTDVNTGALAQGSAGYILRPSDMSRGANMSTQEWTIVVENLFLLNGTD